MKKAGWTFLRRLGACTRGSTAMEFGFILLPLAMLLFGTMEFGRAVWAQNALNYAVEAAARCASINSTTCGSTAQIQTYAATASGMTFTSSIFTVTTAGGCHTVQASYPFTINIPLVTRSFTLTAQSCYP